LLAHRNDQSVIDKQPIMTKGKATYPDRTDIHARKQQGRREAAARTFGEKIAAMEALRERLAPLKRAREAEASRLRGQGKSWPEK
jgi:hypothetical protein